MWLRYEAWEVGWHVGEGWDWWDWQHLTVKGLACGQAMGPYSSNDGLPLKLLSREEHHGNFGKPLWEEREESGEGAWSGGDKIGSVHRDPGEWSGTGLQRALIWVEGFEHSSPLHPKSRKCILCLHSNVINVILKFKLVFLVCLYPVLTDYYSASLQTLLRALIASSIQGSYKCSVLSEIGFILFTLEIKKWGLKSLKICPESFKVKKLEFKANPSSQWSFIMCFWYLFWGSISCLSIHAL